MSLRKLPEVKAFAAPEAYEWEVPETVAARWAQTPVPKAAEADSGATISIYEAIGYDWWTGEGFTAKRMAAALRSIGERPAEVLINSGGGDMFEGLAIYNLLREHPAEVTVKVMGLAASAASIIAMAGDKILMGMGSFMMIHNAWGVVVGNRKEMRAVADTFDQFDAAMAEIYVDRTGLKAAEVSDLMDAETWLRASEAVKKGFADGITDEAAPKASADTAGLAAIKAKQRLDQILASAGTSRSERRRLLKEVIGTHDAAEDGPTHDAGPTDDAFDSNALAALINTLRA